MMLGMPDYNAIFEKVEHTLISVGSQKLPLDTIRANLEPYKTLEGREFSDAQYFWILVSVVFYSGFKASTVTARIEVIRRHFPDYVTVAAYGVNHIAAILNDEQMIKNRKKVEACVRNARTFQEIVCKHGSFQNYIQSFQPTESFENLMLLKEELAYRFDGLGRITPYHVLTDIGMPVLKPDRVICRIFQRLGLIEGDKQLLKTVIRGRKFAQATGYPIRYIDIVFVAYGQMKSEEFGLEQGICLENNPSCNICGVQEHCVYFAQNRGDRGHISGFWN